MHIRAPNAGSTDRTLITNGPLQVPAVLPAPQLHDVAEGDIAAENGNTIFPAWYVPGTGGKKLTLFDLWFKW